ncbi:hypothetical protein DFR50_13947 [Roseiarcus fermentans]|uniref:Porin n=1 Tax=Roseiarcus fermentans TaxID=1473586 RepID=A0A366ESA4_9HYPH|nr:hypothetical protein [Roseiarcus fermentans]RBP04570.1 hypothetical protein DFR50_13947 [Roseiarcus fermentans]
MAPIRAFLIVALALSAFAPIHAAELPSQARKAKTPESAQAQRKCNVGGLVGVLAANGVCVKLSGSVSAEFGSGPIK